MAVRVQPLKAKISRFMRDKRGQVALIWALCGSSLLALAGLGVDFQMAQVARERLLNAADGAALVAERLIARPLAERQAAAEAFFRANLANTSFQNTAKFSLTPKTGGGHRTEVSAEVTTLFGGLVNKRTLTVSAAAEAMSGGGLIEVALVLDNTGSMAADMPALRTSAEDLVNTMFANARNVGDVKMAVVPFVAQVNVGAGYASSGWIDTTGVAPFNGELFEDRIIARRTWSAALGTNCELLSTLPYPGYTGSYRVRWRKATSGSNTLCVAETPSTIDHLSLFKLIGNTSWKGCVEARPEPYDINDTPPNINTPATLFVPYFWADNTDTFANSWMTDTSGDIPNATMTNSLTSTSTANVRRAQGFNIFKFNGQNGTIDSTAPDTTGPNRSCPTPIVPLTTDKSSLVTAVRDMLHWNNSGTNQTEGLAWGWRVLSPAPPFTEGTAYGQRKKVIVLMSDGQNTNINTGSSVNPIFGSDYSSYSYLNQWTTGGWRNSLPTDHRRDAITSTGTFVDYINNRQAQLCTAIKDAGITIFTVIFRENDQATRDLMRNCATPEASGMKYYYVAEDQSQLRSAFQSIGDGIGKLRLTK